MGKQLQNRTSTIWFTLMTGLTLGALLLPADTVLKMKVWAVEMWPWAQSLSRTEEVAGLDKWVHAGLFASLGLLGVLAWRSARSRPALLLGLLALGALTEWLQRFVPGRSMSLADWLADGVGVLVGMALGLAFIRVMASETPPATSRQNRP